MRVQDFPALCMMELPQYVRGRKFAWKKTDLDLLMNEISPHTKDNNPYQTRFVKVKKIYYFNGARKFPMVQCFFRDLRSMYEFKRSISSYPIRTDSYGTIVLKVWETDITPVRKLMTSNNVETCQWLRCLGQVPEEKISTCKKEYIVNWKHINGMKDEECEGWQTYPRIFSYDIEVFSHKSKVGRGVFPNALFVRDCAFLISCIYQQVGRPETRARYGIVYGQCDHIPEDRMRDCRIIEVDKEMKLIDELARLTNELDPEIFTGYNINKFDLPYLNKRLGLRRKEWPNMSRIPSEPTYAETKDWNSRAFGDVSVSKLISSGRITFDVYPYAERTFKLPFYNLETVGNKVLGRGKHDVSAQYMFDTHRMMQAAIKSGNEDAISDAKDRMMKVMLYCIEDSELVLDIFEKANIWLGSVEFASVSGINIEDLYTRGQQISSFSLIYDVAARSGYVINHVELPDMDMSGGFVRDPIAGLHEPVVTIDFTSLYPSIIIGNNLDYTTLVPPELTDVKLDNEEDFRLVEFEQEEEIEKPDEDGTMIKETVIRKYKFKYYQKEEGIVPRILRTLLGARKKVKGVIKKLEKKLENATDSEEIKQIEFTLIILDKKQYALKIRANSIFGFFGAKNGKLPLVAIAASITALGRRYINMTDEYVEKHHDAIVVYNDTDSSFVKLLNTHPRDAKAKGIQIAKEVTELFPDAVVMEYEKAVRVLCIKKKKYAYLFYNDDGNLVTGKKALQSKGIMTARRDNCPFARELYSDVIYNILLKKSPYFITRMVYDGALRLLNGEVGIEDLIIVRKMGATYKSPSYFMKVFGDKMKALGQPIEAGERVGYLVAKSEGKKLLGDRMVTKELYLESLKSEKPLIVDYYYYLDKQIAHHIDQIVSLVYSESLKHIEYQGPRGCKAVYFDEPLAFMSKMIKYDVDINMLEEYVEDLKPKKRKLVIRKKAAKT
jgi:DNA polymerase delta subunit 1